MHSRAATLVGTRRRARARARAYIRGARVRARLFPNGVSYVRSGVDATRRDAIVAHKTYGRVAA